jgi:hypothetical protein
MAFQWMGARVLARSHNPPIKPHSMAVGTWNTKLLFSDPDMNWIGCSLTKQKLLYYHSAEYIFSKEQTVPKKSQGSEILKKPTHWQRISP